MRFPLMGDAAWGSENVSFPSLQQDLRAKSLGLLPVDLARRFPRTTSLSSLPHVPTFSWSTFHRNHENTRTWRTENAQMVSRSDDSVFNARKPRNRAEVNCQMKPFSIGGLCLVIWPSKNKLPAIIPPFALGYSTFLYIFAVAHFVATRHLANRSTRMYSLSSLSPRADSCYDVPRFNWPPPPSLLSQ